MEVRVLGPVEANGVAVTGRDAGVLAALAVAIPHAVTAERLIDDVWGEDAPLTAPKALQNAISRLRRTLGAAAIDTLGGGYRLVPDVVVDIVEVEALAVAGEARAALARWRGEPVAVPPAARARLTELRASLEEDAAAELVADGELDAAVAELERLVAVDPYRERRWSLLVQALAAAGRQGDALRAVQRARRVLADDLGLEPGPELLAAERAVLQPVARPARRSAPRPASSFVGRAAELDDVSAALAQHPIVTLVGPGGVGKTRLAVAASPDDVIFVDLAASARPSHVWEAIAAAAGIATHPGVAVADTVVAAIDPATLLVLDSCEHVLDAAAEVADTVPCGVLATSREPLGLADEHVIAVAPLAPADAVALFADRAGVQPTDEAVEDLCERLDRLPLAIELAAARASILDPKQILARLDDRFGLLDERARRGHPRHRALRAMVEWSVDLLRADERTLFERLSLFRATFTVEDAEDVVADEELPRSAVAPALTRLVRASMVTVGADRRLRLLDTFREFGEGNLVDADRWRERHVDWVSRFAAEAQVQVVGRDQVLWLDRCATMLDDVQAALAWCEERGRAATGLQIAADLFHFWMGRARRHEGLRWVKAFVAAAEEVPALDRCRALYGAGMIAMMQDLVSVEELADLALLIADDRDSRAVAEALSAVQPLWSGEMERVEEIAARCMSVLDEPQHAATMPVLWDIRAWLAAHHGDYEAAREIHGRTIEVLARMEDRHLFGAWLSLDGDLAFAQGRHNEVASLAAEAIDIARAVGCPSCTSSALTTSALVTAAPVDMLVRSYSLVRGIDELVGTLMTLPVLAAAFVDVDPRVAARLAGVDEGIRAHHRIGFEMPGRAAYAAPRLAAGRAALGAAEWDALIGEGRPLWADDALQLLP